MGLRVAKMVNTTMKSVFKTTVSFCAAMAMMAGASLRAEEARLSSAQNQATPEANLTIGTVSPVYGMITLPVSSKDYFSGAVLGSEAFGQDVAARYSASIYGGEVGVFARFADRPMFLATDYSKAFNLGASVGYAGFYFQGAVSGLNENTIVGNLQSSQSLQAGLGYGVGAFDVRVTYAVGQSTPAFAGRSFDNNQWMLGGIYQFAPGIRFNADAFKGTRLAVPGGASAAPTASTPQGTGARVGVQLRF